VARLLLGVTGGIAAYKAVELVRLAVKAGHAVRVVQTPSAQRFVGAASFEGITGAPVLVEEWERDPARGAFPGQQPPAHAPISHLELVRNADAYLIAPASANTIAKLAHGLADNLLTSAALAATCPVFVAPAMNNHMWDHPATRANVAALRERGVHVIEPQVGALGSLGEWGAGRLAEPPELLAAVEAVIPAGERPLDGLRVLVTAGGTREPIDSVRWVGNRSSGRMGYALADEAARRGARVTVVSANVALPRSPGIDYVEVETAADLKAACDAAFEACDVLLMAAAVADYRPAGGSLERPKIKKDPRELVLPLERTEDVLTGLAQRRRAGQVLVGFAAEHGPGALEHGRGKLERKALDAVVVNDISRRDVGFDVHENEVTILTPDHEHHVPRTSKPEVAAAILDEVQALRAARAAAGEGA
jgi:phosphopantothenoylcysteine decarboxylase/phosphopantothenate--cysteine ligase